MSFNAPVVSGYSPFYANALAIPSNGGADNYNDVPRTGRSNTERLVALALSKAGFRGMRRVLRTLNGAAPGVTASDSYARVQGSVPFDSPSGLRPIETVTTVNAATTAAQQSYIEQRMVDALFNPNPSSYPLDASGNGGGGKVRV